MLQAVPTVLQHVAIAVAIGGLIGLEREQEEKRKYAGLRTMSIMCGAGPLAVVLSQEAGAPWIVGIYLLVAGALSLSIAYVRFAVQKESLGFTTSMAVFMVAILGLLVGYGLVFEAVSVSIVTAFLLAEKDVMHKYARQLTDQEISDALILGALVFILYPILPAEPVGPYNAVNLQETLLLAIFVLLIEFTAFLSMRQFGGSWGLRITGLLAGAANSFATAGVMARMGKRSDAAVKTASSSLLLASISMVIRNIAIASALAASLLSVLWIPAAAMIGVTVIAVLVLQQYGEDETDFSFELDSPFSFRAAAKFAAVYIIIAIASNAADQFVGEAGLYVTAFIGGLVSSAAVATSAASLLSNGSAELQVAAGMVLFAIMASLASKIVLVETINNRMRWKANLPLVIIGVTGLLVFFLL